MAPCDGVRGDLKCRREEITGSPCDGRGHVFVSSSFAAHQIELPTDED